jgi:S-DNA-T family DNA segregation ATPase FtsK/SpoIIIE
MAKRKRSKNSNKSGMSVEITGLILVLIGIIGFGFGYIGTLIKEFAMFLLGNWWIIFVIFILLVGLYMLFKRKNPKFFSSRLIGFYLIVLVILTASHFGFLNKINNPGEIFKVFFDQFMDRIHTIDSAGSILNTGDSTISIGGGLFGALSISGLYYLFAKTGTIIVLVILAIFGIILLFDINLGDLFNKTKDIVSSNLEDKPEVEEVTSLAEISEEVEEEIKKPSKNDKIVITKLEDVKNNNKKEEIENNPILIPDVVDSSTYLLPPITLLNEISKQKQNVSDASTMKNKDILERVLKDFQISAKVVEIHIGPAFTQYEMVVPAGTKVSRILSINKEIALALAAKDVRIEAPIPGKSTIGIEVPNDVIASVPFREILQNNQAYKNKYGIMVTLGKNLMGKCIVADLTKMPHLLVAGSTGSGKSVCINSIICSILMNYDPNAVKMVLVDPKKVEFVNYAEIPHLQYPVINDPKMASGALQKIVVEMDQRYDIFSKKGVKKITEYNEWVEKENKRHPETPINKMPYIVVIIDELADLMLVASKEVESSIMRITQLARAAGIHLIVATQRPSTNVITGVIKANIPSRICFAVASQIDSRTAIDMAGAEKLLGRGDMLYIPMGENTPERIQGCYISDEEIERLIKFCTKQRKAKPQENLEELNNMANKEFVSDGVDGYDDPMYDEIVAFAMETGKISASLIQRKFRFGFNRAARMIDLLESRGIVGPQNGSKPREVLIKNENDDE